MYMMQAYFLMSYIGVLLTLQTKNANSNKFLINKMQLYILSDLTWQEIYYTLDSYIIFLLLYFLETQISMEKNPDWILNFRDKLYLQSENSYNNFYKSAL
jgi:hypothetical protein